VGLAPRTGGVLMSPGDRGIDGQQILQLRVALGRSSAHRGPSASEITNH